MLILLVAMAVLLVLHIGTARQANPVKEADAVLDRTKLAILPSQLQQVEAALDTYAAERTGYPGDLDELVPKYLPNSGFLIDPWGTRLRLEEEAGGKATLVSAGPDRAFASGDDIRRSI